MKQYEMFEIEVKGEEPGQSTALAAPEAEFTLNGKKKRIKGFYAGNGIYKVRFYPQEAGEVSWEIAPVFKCQDQQIRLEGNLSGTEECLPGDGSGMVKAEGVHFAYEDGKRYLAFGTTIYAMVHQEKELVEETFASLADSPFNKVRFCVFPKHYNYNHNEPPLFAFEKREGKFDVDRPCFAFWDMLEENICRLERMGIQADLILFHPYDCWGFAELSKEECLVYLDYLLRRLSAFPNLWWSLANEYDLMEHFQKTWWEEFAEFVHENDPYGHLLSNHNCMPYWDFSNKDTTHCCIQDGCVGRVTEFQNKYKKPVVFDECCYEGNIEFPWGNISAFEMTHRFWTAFVDGGYCTHGETYLDENDVLWWAKGGKLHGESPKRIAFLREILEELPGDLDAVPGVWDNISPEKIQEFKNAPSQKLDPVARGVMELPVERLYRFRDGQHVSQGHCQEEAYLRYFGRMCPAVGTMELPEDKKYEIEVIDIWEMTRNVILSNVSGKIKFDLPGKEGIAVLARRIE